MSDKTIHQIIPGAALFDAITTQARYFRTWLREKNIPSEIFAPHIADDRELAREIKPLSAFPTGKTTRFLYHHSLGLPEIEALAATHPAVMVYHNITPAHFFAASDPGRAARARQGRQQLAVLKPHIALAIGDSNHNLQELKEVGYARRAVVPIAVEPQPGHVDGRRPVSSMRLLFVGRLAPNKRQEDLIHLLAECLKIDSAATLTLIGQPESGGYARWLNELIREKGLDAAVHRPGLVDQATLQAAYRQATVYVSMSEHEGFGKPLVESMMARLPVIAYAAAAVPETLGEAGILFHKKEFPLLAKLLAFMHQPEQRPFIDRLLARQQRRAADFQPSAVKKRFFAALSEISWL